MYKRTLNAAEASARPMRESRTQLPARSLDLRDARGEPARTVEFYTACCASATASRYPCGAHRAATSCDLGARALCWQPGSGAACINSALLRRGAALRCAAAAVGTVASIRHYRLPFCGRGASLSRSLYKAQLVVCTHSIATSRAPRALSATMPPPRTIHGAQRGLPAAQPRTLESSRSSALPSQVICSARNC